MEKRVGRDELEDQEIVNYEAPKYGEKKAYTMPLWYISSCVHAYIKERREKTQR